MALPQQQATVMNPNSLYKYQPFGEKFRVPPFERQWPDARIARAPIWCSVDLRDGNQALPVPMGVEEKLELFGELVRIGFEQIEVGFPSASQTEYAFMRRLIEADAVPEGVSVQVLTQAREHLIRRTFESLRGFKRAIVHLYNATSRLQREVTFGGASRADIRKIAVDGARLVRELADNRAAGDCVIDFQYSQIGRAHV